MEIQCEDGARITLPRGSKTLFGRGSGFETEDRTVSRRHLLLGTDRQAGPSPRASFEVLGKNPVWVRRGDNDEICVFRRSDKGELAVGDWFCIAGHQPVWFGLKGVQIEKDDDDGSERDSGSYSALAEGVDVSTMDPVKDFGFVVMGAEFNGYPNQMLRQVKDWEWFLEEPRKNSDCDNDDDEETKARVLKKMKKRGRGKDHLDEDDNDDEWTCEREDERMENVSKQKYSTRSNDPGRRGIKKNSKRKIDFSSREEEDDDDDDTLGGFIVRDDDTEAEEPSDVEEEEEEEFIEADD